MQKRCLRDTHNEFNSHSGGGLTPERAARFGGAVSEGGKTRVRSECTLDVLLNRSLIDDAQHAAGMRLYRDFYFGALEASSSQWNLDSPRGGSGGFKTGFTERQLQARERFHDAMQAMGRVSREILWHVCCLERTLTEFSSYMQYKREGFASERLREALTDLQSHYGM